MLDLDEQRIGVQREHVDLAATLTMLPDREITWAQRHVSGDAAQNAASITTDLLACRGVGRRMPTGKGFGDFHGYPG
jgi:hypothetical protein